MEQQNRKRLGGDTQNKNFVVYGSSQVGRWRKVFHSEFFLEFPYWHPTREKEDTYCRLRTGAQIKKKKFFDYACNSHSFLQSLFSNITKKLRNMLNRKEKFLLFLMMMLMMQAKEKKKRKVVNEGVDENQKIKQNRTKVEGEKNREREEKKEYMDRQLEKEMRTEIRI
uniref:Uncharacterized protein n=1 Tax=Romanomermis culicivorax TaxID=13658 RepID=A0A915I7F7_ROMCU